MAREEEEVAEEVDPTEQSEEEQKMKILPGACYQNFSTSAPECKVCFVAEDCEKETLSKAKKEETPKGKTPKGKTAKGKTPKGKAAKKPQKDPIDVMVEALAESLDQTSHKESPKSLLYGFSSEGNTVKINILKASGKMKITIGDDDEVHAPLKGEKDALELAERIIESVSE